MFGPLVVLLGQDDTDEADDRLAVGEDAHDVGAATRGTRPNSGRG
jgi:hypothetical protein